MDDGESVTPGSGFRPTDEELIGYYLKRKVQGLELQLAVIPVLIEFYEFDPWELADKSFLPTRANEWFFFVPYPNGSCTDRATKAGYWQDKGKDKKVSWQNSLVGYRKTFVFYRGRAPLGDRTDWKMHEYRLCDDISSGTLSFQEPFALCRLIKERESEVSDVTSEPHTKEDGSISSGVISGPVMLQTGTRMGNESNSSSPLTFFDKMSTSENELTLSMGIFHPSSEFWEPDLILACKKIATQSKNDKIDEPETFNIFEGDASSPMPKAPEEGKNCMAHSKVACKTTAKVLPREVIEKQFGKTMKEASQNLNVSLSTFKRKLHELGIPEWPGPNLLKRKAIDSSIVQIVTNEEDNRAIQEPSTIIIDQNTLTIKAELSDDMIKFHLPISQATFVTVEKEIGTRLKLSVGTYKLKYLDEDGDWILLTSNEEMRDCIRSLKSLYRAVIKIRVLPSPQPISGPSGSSGI